MYQHALSPELLTSVGWDPKWNGVTPARTTRAGRRYRAVERCWELMASLHCTYDDIAPAFDPARVRRECGNPKCAALIKAASPGRRAQRFCSASCMAAG